MIKLMIIAIIIIISYGVLLGLMKALGKKTPPMPDVQGDSSDRNYDE